MGYLIKDIFYTLCGEGQNVGQAAVFVRFSGCNLWSGQECDRSEAVCSICDTDFICSDDQSGCYFGTARELASEIVKKWPDNLRGPSTPVCVCTGGEPLLQLDTELVSVLHGLNVKVAVETNGTITLPCSVDWLCVSPKPGAEMVVKSGNELKLLYPQKDMSPHMFEMMHFDNFFIQPIDGASLEANTKLAIEYCLKNPRWRLSIQTHKCLGIL